jgi:hypothetical protein
MNMQATTGNMRWRGFVAVLVLGGLLPLLPTHGQSTPTPRTDSEKEKLQAQLRQLQDELARKRDQLVETERKLTELLGQLPKGPEIRSAGPTPEVEFRIINKVGSKGAREILLREVNGRWIIVTAPDQPGEKGTRTDSTLRTPTAPRPVEPANPAPRETRLPSSATPGRGSDSDRRIDQLEKKLQDLEKLLRELKKEGNQEEIRFRRAAPPKEPDPAPKAPSADGNRFRRVEPPKEVNPPPKLPSADEAPRLR